MTERTLDLRGIPERAQCLETAAVMLFPNEEPERTDWILRALLAHTARIYGHITEQGHPGETELALNARLGEDLGMIITRYGGWPALADATIGKNDYGPFGEQTFKRIQVGKQQGATLFEAITTKRGIGLGGKGKKESSNQPAAAETIESAVKDAGGGFLFSGDNIARKTDRWYSWKNYKPVAHFWCAYVFSSFARKNGLENFAYGLSLENFLEPKLPGFDAQELPGFSKGLTGFLEYAEWILAAAQQTTPAAGPQAPILEEKTVWKVTL